MNQSEAIAALPILTKAHARIIKFGDWTSEAYARNASGQSVCWYSAEACQFCAFGSLLHEATKQHSSGFGPDEYDGKIVATCSELLHAEALKLYPEFAMQWNNPDLAPLVVSINDRYRTPIEAHAAIVGIYAQAILTAGILAASN